GWSITIAAVFVWLGMVVGISFLEAPLKFRAPGVTLALGLGIGRLVFRALNGCEAALAAVVLVGLLAGGRPGSALAAFLVAAAMLALQVTVVRPALTRRSDAVLTGQEAGSSRSRAHFAYVGFEAVKVVALAATGFLLLNQ
ncbi:MAG: hypothetical protein ABWY45_10515, partial [Mycobacterium sp.]